MPKVTITVSDVENPTAETGNIVMALDFDPVLKKDDPMTPAQSFAMELLDLAQQGMDIKETKRE